MAADNSFMVIPGRVMGGVVVLEGSVTLPEGVDVVPRPVPVMQGTNTKRRVVLPLVDSKHPGAIRLSAQRIAEILEEDDLSA
jgi:hypothetical protein